MGKVGGAVLKARSDTGGKRTDVQEAGSQCQPRTISDANDRKAIDARERFALGSIRVREEAPAQSGNVATGLVSPLEYRVTKNALLATKSGLLDAIISTIWRSQNGTGPPGVIFNFRTTPRHPAAPGRAGVISVRYMVTSD